MVAVEYAGAPEPVVDPDESIEGWMPTDDGAFVVNEPQGAPGWFPVNDTPRDKATYDIEITVPRDHSAIGQRAAALDADDRGGRTTWRWLEDSPMASYLATATNGLFDTRFGRLANGAAEYNAVDPQTRVERRLGRPNPALAWERLAHPGRDRRLLPELYGAYPFDAASAAIIDWAPDVGYALESQTQGQLRPHRRARRRWSTRSPTSGSATR